MESIDQIYAIAIWGYANDTFTRFKHAILM
jgi:hypothetical protein